MNEIQLVVKTTIEIPDALFQRAAAVGAERDATFDQLVIESLERAFAEPQSAKPQPLHLTPKEAEIFEICDLGFPVLKKRPVPPPEEFLQQIDDLREDLGV